MAHPLDGAYQRVNRARVHIDELDSLIDRFRKQYEDEFIPDNHPTQTQILDYLINPGTKSVLGIYDRPISELPEDIPIVVGEVIYNLRAALDYLVYELSGRKDRTQFPIEHCKLSKDGKHGFDTRRTTYLNGLTDSQVAAIEKLQPYKGCRWMKTLRDISNPDKHRHLTAVDGGYKQTIVIQNSFVFPPPNIGTEAQAPNPERIFDLKRAIDVTFPDGEFVMTTVHFLEYAVKGVLISFQSEFK